MGTNYCCKPNNTKEEQNNEVHKEEKTNINNNKIITEYENYDDIKHIPNSNDYPKENLNHIVQTNSSDTAIPIKEIEEVIAKAPKLKIEVINSSINPRGIISITPFGIEKGLRNIQDGVTYFGYENNILPKTIPTIDYLIKPKDAEYDERYNGKHFQIKFNPNYLKYYLKDLGHGFGTFIQITSKTIIKHNMLLNIGENYIVFTLGLEEDILLNENFVHKNPKKTDLLLNVKIFSGNIRHGILSFAPENCPIHIGRNADCEIFIDDSMVSRINSTITYENDIWIIRDGSIINGQGTKKSTNGTWIYAHDEIEINDQMTFKSNHNLFFCSYQ